MPIWKSFVENKKKSPVCQSDMENKNDANKPILPNTNMPILHVK